MAELKTPPTEVRQWPPPQGQWTHEDWLKLPQDGWRYEVIKGELFMDPAPTEPHQRVSANLQLALMNFVRVRQLGRVHDAPIEVLLGESPVQPDLLFIAQTRVAQLATRERIVGAPDLIVEIRSPGSWMVDRREKFTLYRETGVREYWILEPDRCEVEVFVLREGRYELLGKWGAGETARSDTLAGFAMGLDEVCGSAV